MNGALDSTKKAINVNINIIPFYRTKYTWNISGTKNRIYRLIAVRSERVII